MFKLLPLPRTLSAGLRDLGSKKVDVRVSAVRDLGRLAQTGQLEAIVPGLERALCTDPAAAVRAAAAEALADAEARQSLSSLVTALRDPSIGVRQRALLALGELADAGDRRACQAVEQAVSDPAPELRFQAMVALGRLRGREGTEWLLKGTRDSDSHVRYIAWRVLEEQWCEQGAESATLPEPVRIRARAALRDEAPAVRLVTAILLGRKGDRAGERVIVDAVSSTRGRREPEDESAAIELAGDLGLREARVGLRRRAFGWLGGGDGATAFQARVALAKLGDQRAVQVILRDLAGGSRDRRTLAVAAAGQARLRSARGLIQAMLGDDGRADQTAVTEALERIDGAAEAATEPSH